MPLKPGTLATVGVALLLVLLVGVVFARTRQATFVDFDDGEYVYENPEVLAGLTPHGIRWAFTTTRAANWHPLTWISHMLDVSLFGLDAGAHHLTSVVLHAAASVTLFLMLLSSTGRRWPSAFVAAAFAVHPLHVESVAWVAERKDVLAGLFWFTTMAAYVAYARHGGRRRFGIVIACFVLGLLSKPMLVTLPCVLLLWDAWPLRRLVPAVADRNAVLWRLVKEKLPFVALAGASSLTTAFAQSSWGATAAWQAIPFQSRLANAAQSYLAYLHDTFWPGSLAFFYPHPLLVGLPLSAARTTAALLLLAAISYWALSTWRTRPHVTVGWLWFLGTLVPVIGLVQVGSQARADRYMYVPAVGLFLAIAWEAADRLGPRRSILAGSLAVVTVVTMAAVSWRQVGYWRDPAALYRHALAVTSRNMVAWNNLGMHHLGQGATEEALSCFQQALQAQPDYAEARYNLGVTLGLLGRSSEAMAAYQQALRLDPRNADGWVNLAILQRTRSDTQQAISSLLRAIELRPGDPLALANLVLSHAARGDRGAASQAFEELRRVDPELAGQLAAQLAR